MEKSVLDWIALVLVIVGAVNWGLVGLFGLDLVDTLLGPAVIGTEWVANVIYILVGLAGLWMIYMTTKN